jgi:DNA-binding GntR family transcriptional regulator
MNALMTGPTSGPAPSTGLNPLHTVSLREQAREAIRTAIITGEMESGRVYSVPLLAEQFGVSLTPVREAMLDLVNEHLLEPVRNKGFRVPTLSDRDLEDIFQIRVLLEASTMRQIAGPLPAGRRTEFTKLADRIEEYAQAGDVTGFLATDRQFHLGLLGLLGNQRLVEIVGSLRDQTRLYGLMDLIKTNQLTGSAREHAEILASVAAGDGARAEELTRRHLEHTRGVWAGRAEQENQAKNHG